MKQLLCNTIEDTGERLVTNTFNENTIEHLHRYVMASEYCVNKCVLDIASGEGYGSNLLSRTAKSVFGIDVSVEAIIHAKNKYTRDNLKYLQGSADAIPLETSSVDVVVSFETLEHHEKHEEMFCEIKRVLRKGGMLIMSTPDKKVYSDLRNYSNAYHVKELYFEEFKDIIDRHFNNYLFMYQRTVYGSMISSEVNNGQFVCYKGGLDNAINTTNFRDECYFNICIASDEEFSSPPSSHYDGLDLIVSYNKLLLQLPILHKQNEVNAKQLDYIRNSISFRIGRILTWPLRQMLPKTKGSK